MPLVSRRGPIATLRQTNLGPYFRSLSSTSGRTDIFFAGCHSAEIPLVRHYDATRVNETHASDAAYSAAAEGFEPKDLVDLTIAIAAMNAFYRLGAPYRLPVAAKP